MSEFYIDVEKTSKSVTALRNHKESLVGQRRELNKVYNNLWLSNETETIKQILEKLDQNIKLEADEVEFMANALESIINLYTQTENKILMHIRNEQNPAASNNQTGGNSEGSVDKKDEEENPLVEPKNIYTWLSEQTGIPQDVLEAIAFILSFIPVVNCATDLIDLINDYNELNNDDELDIGERIVIILDAAFLLLDVVAIGKIIKGATEATKIVKAANTEAKKASKEAERAAKKAAERAGKKGKSTVRAVNRANTAAKKAEEAKQAAKNTKKIAFDDFKELLKKEIRNNEKHYIEPDPESPLKIPGIIKDMYREQIKQQNYTKNRTAS